MKHWIVQRVFEVLDLDILSKTGDVALDNCPNCDFFVIHITDGFSPALWQSGMSIISAKETMSPGLKDPTAINPAGRHRHVGSDDG